MRMLNFEAPRSTNLIPPPPPCYTPPTPKDPAILEILRRSKFTMRSKFAGTVIYYGGEPCADIIFLGFTGFSPLKEGFAAK